MHDFPRLWTKGVIGCAVIAAFSGAIAAACGGSASESPWPVPPESPVLGPEGEEGKTQPLDRPDAAADAALDVEP